MINKIILILMLISGATSAHAQQNKDTIHTINVKPLYVIDGTIAGNNALEKMNPGDIESIDVLKGNTAMALYGERGRDGVIVINTKAAGKKRFWTLLCSVSNEYRKIMPSPESDSIATYKVNGELHSKSSEKRLYNLNEKDIKTVMVSEDQSTLANGSSGKKYIVAIETNGPK
jgi:TonB-dependent SusC/RagA subfamily outer membrane receptor